MAEIYDKTDLLWTNRGDYYLNNGDIGDTSTDPLRSLYQEVHTRIKSDLQDWKNFPRIGATLSDFVGEANNKHTAEAIKTRIVSSLTNDGLIKRSDLTVKYIPVDIDNILFRLSIKVAPTAINGGSNILSISLLYNYGENNIFVR
jgi:hypothetical protein